MKNIAKLSLLTVFLVFTAALYAQKANVQLKLKKGDTFITEMNMTNKFNQEMMGQQIEMNQEMTMTSTLSVADVLENGNYKMEQVYNEMKINMLINGQKMSISTNDLGDNPENEALKNLTEIVISYEVSPKGKVSNIKGFDALLKNVAGNQQVAQLMKNVASDNTLASYYGYIPQKTVKVGDSYESKVKMEELMGIDITTQYTVLDIEKKHIKLSLDSDFDFSPNAPIEQNGMKFNMKGTGNQTGNFYLYKKCGMPKSSDMTQSIDLEMGFKNPANNENMTIPLHMTSDVKFTVTKK